MLLRVGQALLEEHIEKLRVGFTLTRFHNLTDEKPHQFIASGTVLGDFVRVGCEHLVNQTTEGARVAHL